MDLRRVSLDRSNETSIMILIECERLLVTESGRSGYYQESSLPGLASGHLLVT